MAYPILLLAVAAGTAPPLEVAQTTYTQCLSTAFDAAVSAGMPPGDFTAKVATLCPGETVAYKNAMIARKLADDRKAPGFREASSRTAALQMFADADAANRQAMLTSLGVSVQSKKAPTQAKGAAGGSQ